MILKGLMAMVGFGVVAVGTWGYVADYHVSTAPAAAQRTVRQWIGPVKSQSVAGGQSRIVWVGYGGYLHRDWDVQEFICSPGPSTCPVSYAYTVFVNGQTGRVDRAMIDTGPGLGGWPLAVVHTARATGGA